MPSNATPPPNLPLLFAQAREEVLSRIKPILDELGVTEQQWRILRVLRQREPMEPREICATCLFLSPSLVGVLSRMEELGLVRKERVDSDHRRLLVHMTARSRRMVDTAMPQIARQYQQLDSELGPEWSARMHEVLERVIALGTRRAG